MKQDEIKVTVITNENTKEKIFKFSYVDKTNGQLYSKFVLYDACIELLGEKLFEISRLIEHKSYIDARECKPSNETIEWANNVIKNQKMEEIVDESNYSR